VIDTWSTDNTVKEVKKFTDEIYHFEWCDDFAKARNFVLWKCSKDFIMRLDADDNIDKKSAKEIKKLLWKEINWDTLSLQYKTQTNSKWVPNAIQRRKRIIRNYSSIVWENPIHESIRTPNGTRTAFNDKISILHHNIAR